MTECGTVMTSDLTVRERLRRAFRWQEIKSMLVIVGIITIMVSMFEFSPDLLRWFREILSNFVITVSIIVPAIALTSVCGLEFNAIDRKRMLLFFVVMTASGIIGGFVSWLINSWLFDWRVTHLGYFLLVLAVLANMFGFSTVAYQTVSSRLKHTRDQLAEKEIYEQKLLRLKTKAELEALRAKINPHFLFNTLNSIASLIPVDPDKAEQMVQKLSNLFSRSLRTSMEDLVPLREELGFVEAYLEIEKVRLGDRLSYVISCDEMVGDTAIPGLLLQPLVENSVKYGIVPEKDGGRIELHCTGVGDSCEIRLEDTGKGFDTISTEEGFGLSGVRERLNLCYESDHLFEMSGRSGVQIRIRLPKRVLPATLDVEDQGR